MVASRIGDLKTLNSDERAELATLEVRPTYSLPQPCPCGMAIVAA